MAELDLERLEEAYSRALALEKSGDLDAAARAWQEVLAIDPEDHGGAAVRLASIGRGEPPQKAPDAYVETLFDQTAEVFDEVLVDQLGYSVPEQLRRLIEDVGIDKVGRALDLGCGTGLTGAAIREFVTELTGVDLSENMVAMAWDREVYDDLYVAEAVRFLEEEEEGEPWELITATDVMPYIGELGPILRAAAAHIAPGGHLAFSTETLPEADFAGRPWTVGPHQRFAHREDHVRDLLEACGFSVIAAEPITVRHERGEPIRGHLVLARKR